MSEKNTSARRPRSKIRDRSARIASRSEKVVDCCAREEDWLAQLQTRLFAAQDQKSTIYQRVLATWLSHAEELMRLREIGLEASPGLSDRNPFQAGPNPHPGVQLYVAQQNATRFKEFPITATTRVALMRYFFGGKFIQNRLLLGNAIKSLSYFCEQKQLPWPLPPKKALEDLRQNRARTDARIYELIAFEFDLALDDLPPHNPALALPLPA